MTRLETCRKSLLIVVALVGLVSLAAGSTGCTPRLAGNLVGAAVLTAAVVGTAAAIAAHDAHFHHYNCGCPRHWQDGHWVFHYQGGWEYYDGQGGVWYRYAD
jgi:hypothetical protein